jgi:hypothetical protein
MSQELTKDCRIRKVQCYHVQLPFFLTNNYNFDAKWPNHVLWLAPAGVQVKAVAVHYDFAVRVFLPYRLITVNRLGTEPILEIETLPKSELVSDILT